MRASWAAPRPGGSPTPERHTIAVRRRLEATTRDDGTYLACDLPRGDAIDVSVIVGEQEVGAEALTIGAADDGAIRELTVVLP